MAQGTNLLTSHEARILAVNAGSEEQPVYFTGGEPTATSYSLKATVNDGDAKYVAYYSNGRLIASSKPTYDMRMPAHYYHNLYEDNPTEGTNVYVHYYNTDTTSTNTYANLRVKSGSTFKTLLFGGDGNCDWEGNILAIGGILQSTANGNTVQIGSQNNGFCHITSSANVPFWFNKDILMENGKTIGGANTAYRPFQIFLGRHTTSGSNALNAGNPLIEFSNADRSQYCQLIYDDYDSLCAPDSLTLVGNQDGINFICKNGPIWIQGGSNAGGNVNRLNTTSGTPGNMQYNTSRRGTQIYSNGIAFADPYNGNNNNDAGWIRHIETSANNGILEIAVGDDGAEEIIARQYNTSNNVARQMFLLNAEGFTSVSNQSTDPAFNHAAMQIREANYSLSGSDTWGQAPRLAWHWGNRVAAQIGLASNGWLYEAPQTSTDFYRIVCETGTWGINITGSAGSVAVGGTSLTQGRLNINTGANPEGNNVLGHGVSLYHNSEGGNITIYSGNVASYGSYYWEIDAYNGDLRAYNVNSAGTYKGQVYIRKDNVVLFGAAWNDYAEMRNVPEANDYGQEGQQSKLAGRCVQEVGDDTMIMTNDRLQPGCKIVSDTFGFNIGETEECKTPIAVSGRVLAYLYEGREAAKQYIGHPVCSGPDGTVSIMTEDEEKAYPSRIVGIISAVPDYKYWGTGNVEVNGRIWIYVR